MKNPIPAVPSVTRIPVAVQSDFVQRQAHTSPLQALAECVWNSLDADARLVEIEFDRNAVSLQSITVRDNGRGVTRERAPELFSKLGDSWKKRTGRSENGRQLHGSEGRGRYKVTVLGRVADWKVTYAAEDGTFRRFTITVIQDDLKEIRITNEEVVQAEHTGVELVITEPMADFRSLQSEETPQDLAEIFATYMRNYADVVIAVQGAKIDPTALMADKPAELNLADIQEDGKAYPVRLEIVEWTRKTKRILYLCDDRGFPFLPVDTRWHVGERFFSAYLRSSLIKEMNDKNIIGMAEMNVGLQGAIDEAKQSIKDHFRAKQAQEAQSVVDGWKAENTYPFRDEPASPVDRVEREVFDIMATTAARLLPDFSSAPPKSRAFQLRMIRTAIENGSEDLQLIMTEVLNLPAKLQEELALLIQESSLRSVITANRVISNRLKFLTALEALIFDRGMGATLRERTQLQRLLVDNTWVFGEEHHLMVDDQGLDECLKQHTQAKQVKVTKGAVKHPTKTRGIVDLMFGKKRTSHRPGELEHLVIELKAPSVPIGAEQIAQIEGYVQAITKDSRFDKASTKWFFWALSREVNEDLLGLRQVQGADPGVIIKQNNLTVLVKTWAQIISENRSRMKFFQESLQISVTKADSLRHLKEGYRTVFKDSPVEAQMDAVINGHLPTTDVDGFPLTPGNP